MNTKQLPSLKLFLQIAIMAAKMNSLTTFLILIIFINQSLLSVSTNECNPINNKQCEQYLTIHLHTNQSFPPATLESEWDIFASSFHAMTAQVCKYDLLPHPSLYYIRIDVDSDAQTITLNNQTYTVYDFEFGLNVLCDTQSMECCQSLHNIYLKSPLIGPWIDALIKNSFASNNNNSIWQYFELMTRVNPYSWQYKLSNSTFPTPTSSPTLNPTPIPTQEPTMEPTIDPTIAPTIENAFILKPDHSAYEMVALYSEIWIILIVIYAVLLMIGYIAPLVWELDNQFAPKCYACADLSKFFFALIVFANFFMQIFLCSMALTHANTIKLWHMQCIFGLQCANLGIYHIFLLIIVNDRRCAQFDVLTPKFINSINIFLTLFILIFSAVHAMLIGNDELLWMLFVGLSAQIGLFIVHLAYYWYKGKNFSGGKPFLYTEGTRECMAIAVMIGGVALYCFAGTNGCIIWQITKYHATHHMDGYVLAFECIHWLSLSFLAAIIFAIRKFLQYESQKTEEKKVNNMNKNVIPDTDSDGDDDDIDSTMSSHDMMMANYVSTHQHVQMVAVDDEESIDEWPQSPIAHQNETQNQNQDENEIVTDHDAMTMTMSFEPQLDGIKSGKSESMDSDLYHIPNSLQKDQNENEFEFEFDPTQPHEADMDDDEDEKVRFEYSPINSEHGHMHAPLDMITDDHAEHFVGVTMSIPDKFMPMKAARHDSVSVSSLGIFDWATPPPLSTIKSENVKLDPWMESDVSVQSTNKSLAQWDKQKRGTSISRRHSTNQMNLRNYHDKHRHIKLRRARSLQSAEDEHDGFDFDDQDAKLHETNDANDHMNLPFFMNQTGAHQSVQMDQNSAMNSSPFDPHEHSLSRASQSQSQSPPVVSPFAQQNLNSNVDDVDEEKAEIRGVDDHDVNKFHRERQEQIVGTHSRQNTAGSLTATFSVPSYQNIITAHNDAQQINILQTQSLYQIPYNKTTHHLDSGQREIVNIFEGNKGK